MFSVGSYFFLGNIWLGKDLKIKILESMVLEVMFLFM